jgi:hypothetical protein
MNLTPRSLLRTVALALGTLVGIYSPTFEARAQFLTPWARRVGEEDAARRARDRAEANARAEQRARDAYVRDVFKQTVVVRQFTSGAAKDYPVNMFRLGFTDGTEAVLSLKPTLPLAQFLRAHNGQRVALAFEVQ